MPFTLRRNERDQVVIVHLPREETPEERKARMARKEADSRDHQLGWGNPDRERIR